MSQQVEFHQIRSSGIIHSWFQGSCSFPLHDKQTKHVGFFFALWQMKVHEWSHVLRWERGAEPRFLQKVEAFLRQHYRCEPKDQSQEQTGGVQAAQLGRGTPGHGVGVAGLVQLMVLGTERKERYTEGKNNRDIFEMDHLFPLSEIRLNKWKSITFPIWRS